MGFYTTTSVTEKPHPETPSCAQKTASGKIFTYPIKTQYKNRHNSLKTKQEKPLHTHKTASGVFYYKFRHYSAELGRWPARDPIGEKGGVNLYAFVGNDGVNLWDRLGLAWRLSDTEIVGLTSRIVTEYKIEQKVFKDEFGCCYTQITRYAKKLVIVSIKHKITEVDSVSVYAYNRAITHQGYLNSAIARIKRSADARAKISSTEGKSGTALAIATYTNPLSSTVGLSMGIDSIVHSNEAEALYDQAIRYQKKLDNLEIPDIKTRNRYHDDQFIGEEGEFKLDYVAPPKSLNTKSCTEKTASWITGFDRDSL